MISYLNDKDFLKEICSKKNRSLSVRITSYTNDNEPIESIEGKVTQGSINIDGTSSTRRSCSLTIQTENLNIHDFYWSLTTRFKAEIGILNTTNKYKNEQIIWFPMGYYVISSFSISLSTTGASVSIQGKDKMSMLNGDLGGKLTAETDFGIEDIISTKDGKLIHYNIPIKEIIKEAVHTYGQEDYSHIIINDLDDYGLNLETYRGENPIWILIPTSVYSDVCDLKLITNENYRVYDEEGNSYKIKEIESDRLWKINNTTGEESGTIFYNDINIYETLIPYWIRKIEYDNTCGYLLTNLIYAGELIGKTGENITNILDKIKTMLGDFEYFYDINGYFVFQRQKAYKDNGAYQLTTDNDGVITDVLYEDIDLTLTDLSLITQLSNNIQINNLKNDYTVWGQKKGVSGGNIQIHMRYVIDQKPDEVYNSIELTQEQVNEIQKQYPHQAEGLRPMKTHTFDPEIVDWRELIYQMAQDYSKLHYIDQYKYWLKMNNPEFYKGITGYEQYYTDLLGFWRQIYHPYWDEININKNTTKVEDLYFTDRYYAEVDKDDDIYYLLNKSLAADDKRNVQDDEKYSGRGSKNTINYKVIAEEDRKKFNFNTKYKYVYGPLIPTTTGATRTLIGDLDTICKQNYKILMYFYFSKYILEHPEIEDSYFKDTSYLYYYDPMSCVPKGWYKDGITEEEKQELMSNLDDLSDFEQAKDFDCYHKVLQNGDVESYYIWNDISTRTAKEANKLNLFTIESSWYRKDYYQDEEGKQKVTFQSLGTYYPLAPNQKTEFLDDDQYRLATQLSKGYLRKELKRIDPEAQLDTTKDFEVAYEIIANENKLTQQQKYSIVALYNGIRNYYIPELLSFLKDSLVSGQDVQFLTESNSLVSKINDDWIVELFVQELARPKIMKNGQEIDNPDFNFINTLLNIDTTNTLTDDEMNRLGDYSLYNLKNTLTKLISMSKFNKFFTALFELCDLNIPIEEQEIGLEDDEITMLLYIFPDAQSRAIQTMDELKTLICNRVYMTLQKDARENQNNFKQNNWLSSPEYQTFITQVYYNLSEEIVDQEYFDFEITEEFQNLPDEEKKIIPYLNYSNLALDEENKKYINFTNNIKKDETITGSSKEKPDIRKGMANTANGNFKIYTSATDSNIELIEQIINIIFGDNQEISKMITWPMDFNLDTGWHKDIYEAPENLLFWFDFLDNPISSLYKYSVKNIGQRAMVKNDNSIKVIKYLPTQNLVLINNSNSSDKKEENVDFEYNEEKIQIYKTFHDGYKYLNIQEYNSNGTMGEIDLNNLTLSANGKSAFVAIENLLYNYGYAQEGISISCIPQYFLQPNTKIAIYDDITKINGEYIITKISIPLSYNGTMSITATKAVDKLERSEITNDK